MKKLLLLVCLVLSSYSNEVGVIKNSEKEITLISSLSEEKTIIKLEYLHTLENGMERDFYINEFLQQDISSSDAYETLSLIDNMNDEMFHHFANKFAHDETFAVSQCMKMTKDDLVDSYADCIAVGLSLEDISNLSALDLDLVKQKIGNKYPTLSKYLKVISSSIPFTKLITLKKDQFYELYFGVSQEFRTKYFNYKLPKRTFQKIFIDKKNFDKFLEITLKNREQKVLNKSLLRVDDEGLKSNSSFLLALNALGFNDLNSSYKYLESALEKSSTSFETNRINFWLYKVTKNEEYLEKVLENKNIDIYSILLNELANKKIKVSFKENKEFKILIKDFNLEKKALFYSLAENKSSFNKNKISKEFNIGVMQVNIYLLKSIRNSILENKISTIDSYFTLEDNISLASIYVDTIMKSYKNPIFRLLAYENKSETINKLKSFKNKEYQSLLAFEFSLKKDEDYIKNLISSYYLYINSFIKNKKEFISLEAIFQTLVLQPQTLNE